MALNQKKCKACPEHFIPARPLQVACSPACAQEIARRNRAKAEKRAATIERQKMREKLEAMKTVPQLIAEADRAFCAFIRARDEGKPCICCGRISDAWTRGGTWDAGHYRSRGAASHLRYHEDNCHRQLKQCNRRAFDVAGYRANLVARIGLERVERLEQDNGTHKWTRGELIEIRRHYTAKRKALEAA